MTKQCIRKLSVERDCAESQSQQYRWLALTPNLLRLVLRTQPRSWPRAKFTDNLLMHGDEAGQYGDFALRTNRQHLEAAAYETLLASVNYAAQPGNLLPSD